MRAGRGAAVGVVTEGVDVEATLGVGVLAADVPGDGGRRRLGVLLEDDGTRDLRVPADDSDYVLKLGVSNLLRRLGSSRPMGHRKGPGKNDKAMASRQLNTTVCLAQQHDASFDRLKSMARLAGSGTDGGVINEETAMNVPALTIVTVL